MPSASVPTNRHRKRAFNNGTIPKGEALMIAKIFIATALVGFTIIAPAMANDVRIEQYGWSNSSGGAQNGYRNRIRVYQDGSYNRMNSRQYGRDNLSAVGQQGYGNYGETYQSGNRNTAGIGQFGSNHTTIITQDGNGNITAGVQVGHQGGNGNVAAFVQACP
jgi:minor curlin subunit